MSGAGRTRARPTVFGIVVVVALVAAAVVRPQVADPSVTGLVWAGLLGAVLLGVIWPLLAVRLVGVQIVNSPDDLVVGQLGSLELELSGRASGLAVGVTGSGASVIDMVAPGRVRVPLTIGHRGAYRQVRIDLGSDAPFGILWVSRSRVVELPHQLLVGPSVEAVDAMPRELAGQWSDPLPLGAGSNGEAVRSVRPYVTGDPVHLVHWPSTARIGSLVVRELEPPATRGLAVVVDLGGERDDPDLVEQVASRAAGAARSARSRGARVVLCTVEHSGPVAAEAPDELAVQRRLALAVHGAPPDAPDGWPALRLSPGSVPTTAAGR